MADADALEPNLADAGVAVELLADGQMLRGRVGEDDVVLIRQGGEFFAVGATCTHYSGPLAEGLFDGECLRCPWHHARFDVRTGDAVAAPALDPVPRYDVEARAGRLFVRPTRAEPAPVSPAPSPAGAPSSVVILGAGAAGNAAAEMLRRAGYAGTLTLVGAEPDVPYDRPNLSKDYLAGKAQPDWVPLRSADFYAARDIQLRLGTRATAIDAGAREMALEDGSRLPYGALLLATGAEARRLDIPGGDLPHVHTLRSLADSNAIIAAAEQVGRAVIVGASFIGLEVAASLRERGIEVDVVSTDTQPLLKVMGPRLGGWIRGIHERHGVRFHMERRPVAIDAREVRLDDGSRLEAPLVVAGIGVLPRVDLARAAGVTDGPDVPVDEHLQTRVPGIWAAGDIARWPDPRSGEAIRVEHWVVAERQGQVAARNMLGLRERFAEVPFFWSQHYDRSINYVGHAQRWERIDVAGSVEDGDALLAYRAAGRTLAVASVRNLQSLEAEVALGRGDEAALQRLVPPGE